MRHLGSLLAGVVLAPLVWVIIALGQAKSSATLASWQELDAYDTKKLIAPAAYLAAAGLLLGLVATLRLSPLGPVIAGAGYVVAYGWLFLDPFRILDAVPNRLNIFGLKVSPEIPLTNGTLLLIGSLLLVSVFSAKRWRRWPEPVAAPAGTTGTGIGSGSGAGTGTGLGSPASASDRSFLDSTWPPPAPGGEPASSRTGTFDAVRDTSAEPRYAPLDDDGPTHRVGVPNDTPWSSPPRGNP